MTYLVKIFLPVTGSDRNRENLSRVRDELTTKFGGVTMLLDSPAEGIWKGEGDERDRIAIAEDHDGRSRPVLLVCLPQGAGNPFSPGRTRRPGQRNRAPLSDAARGENSPQHSLGSVNRLTNSNWAERSRRLSICSSVGGRSTHDGDKSAMPWTYHGACSANTACMSMRGSNYTLDYTADPGVEVASPKADTRGRSALVGARPSTPVPSSSLYGMLPLVLLRIAIVRESLAGPSARSAASLSRPSCAAILTETICLPRPGIRP